MKSMVNAVLLIVFIVSYIPETLMKDREVFNTLLDAIVKILPLTLFKYSYLFPVFPIFHIVRIIFCYERFHFLYFCLISGTLFI